MLTVSKHKYALEILKLPKIVLQYYTVCSDTKAEEQWVRGQLQIMMSIYSGVAIRNTTDITHD